jgi:hypothetical protein
MPVETQAPPRLNYPTGSNLSKHQAKPEKIKRNEAEPRPNKGEQEKNQKKVVHIKKFCIFAPHK